MTIQVDHFNPVRTGADRIVERLARERVIERLSLFVDRGHPAPGEQDGDGPLRR